MNICPICNDTLDTLFGYKVSDIADILDELSKYSATCNAVEGLKRLQERAKIRGAVYFEKTKLDEFVQMLYGDETIGFLEYGVCLDERKAIVGEFSIAVEEKPFGYGVFDEA